VCESEPDRRATKQQRVFQQSNVQVPNHGENLLIPSAGVNGIFATTLEPLKR